MAELSEHLGDYFQRYGWQFEERRPGLYRTGFYGDSGPYEIWLRTTKNWIYFTINPYVRAAGKNIPVRALETLLDLNYGVNLAKFIVDTDGDIALSVELPVEGFGYSHFVDALTALSHYADEYHEHIEVLVNQKKGEVV